MWPFNSTGGLPKMKNPPSPPKPPLHDGDRVVVNFLLSSVFGKIVRRYNNKSPLSDATDGVWYIVEDDEGKKHNCWGKLVNKY